MLTLRAIYHVGLALPQARARVQALLNDSYDEVRDAAKERLAPENPPHE